MTPSSSVPLFRFNRDFYELDERGRPIGHRNLDVLANRVSSVMLRRRKEDVEKELPGRTTKTFFVPMTEAQLDAYEGYEFLARRLAAVAARRPLTPEEFKLLQGHLACMRMICDTPYILDGRRHECPKMEEIERLIPDLMDDPERKIIIFSEWVRMLELVRDYAAEAGIEFAWHTGSVPQYRRRAEIKRFREDPDCRLFLSSESGGVGLNLQAADTVINLDQPWNPARLEQRIARAWRKHQSRPVNVINLVSEHTIEHRMLGLLDAKRTLAEGVLDRRGDLTDIPLPTSRAAFVERMQAVLGAGAEGKEEAAGAPAPTTALDRLREDLVGEHGAALKRILVREGEDTALVVVALPAKQLAEEERRLAGAIGLNVKLIDPAAHEAMLRLAEAGLISMPAGELREVYPAPGAEGAEDDSRLLRGRSLVDRAEHKLKAAALLEGGGFSEEARAPATEAARLATGCLAALGGDSGAGGRRSRRRVPPRARARGGRAAARCSTHPGRRGGRGGRGRSGEGASRHGVAPHRRAAPKRRCWSPGIVARDRDHIERVIAGALASGAPGVNILLYGPPGTGKTEFCKVLADRRGAHRSWEVSQVYEMLTWMESHPLLFTCTTNFGEHLDIATLRRFVFMVRLDYLAPEQEAAAFRAYFALPPPAGVTDRAALTPGYFAVVHRKAGFLWEARRPGSTRGHAPRRVRREANPPPPHRLPAVGPRRRAPSLRGFVHLATAGIIGPTNWPADFRQRGPGSTRPCGALQGRVNFNRGRVRPEGLPDPPRPVTRKQALPRAHRYSCAAVSRSTSSIRSP